MAGIKKLSDALTPLINDKIISLDLSCNNLSELSLPKLRDFAKQHQELKSLILTKNSITLAGLLDLVDLAAVKTLEHIVVCSNPIVLDVDYSKIPTEVLQKLILVPHHWLQTGIWKRVARLLSDKVDEVVQVHKQYYDKILNRTNWTKMPNIEQAIKDITQHPNSSTTRELLIQLKQDPNNSQAAKKIAECYQIGYTFKQNSFKAARWWSYAAHLGDAEALYCVGQLFETGEGIKHNPMKGEFFKVEGLDAGYIPTEYKFI